MLPGSIGSIDWSAEDIRSPSHTIHSNWRVAKNRRIRAQLTSRS